MNITFNTIKDQRQGGGEILSSMEAERGIGTKSARAYQGMTNAFSVDLETSFFSNDAYAQNAKNIDDITSMATNTDVQTTHNYMALLSNTLSEEDYAKALQDGFDLKNLSSAETVTILDKIKSELLKAGVEITGYNDDISTEKLAKITGSATFANALKKSFSEADVPLTTENVKDAKEAYSQLSEIDSLEDSAIKYLVLNDKEATIGNIYLAQHATNGQNASGRGFYAQEAGGYYAEKADSFNWEQLKPQIDKIVEQADLAEEGEKAIDAAKWTLEQGIPLTSENLTSAFEYKNIEFPIPEQITAKAIATAISDGKRAVEGNILHPESLIQKRIKLEETRLEMTVKANTQLMNSDFSIDTKPMEDLINSLKNALERTSDEVTGEAVDQITNVETNSGEEIFRLSLTRAEIIRRGPVDVVGRMAVSIEEATLTEISNTSAQLYAKFKAAGEGYEALMTSPRADLGDSIKKAFRNVDDILKDLGQEITEENRRAVRILGYNTMQIDEENFEKVRAWDSKLTATLERLKPGAVLDLIRDGKNPLNMTLEELSSSLDKNDSKEDGRKDEKYSRFLYKLEKKGDITEEEKKSYIGIYRLFHTLKATDYEAIGSLLKTGREMTVGNLLEATRNQKASRRGIDVKADDEFGGISLKETTQTLKIDEQINSAFIFYSSKADIVYENLEPEKLKKASPDANTLLPKLAEDLEQAEPDMELEREYVRQELSQMRQLALSKQAEGALEEIDTLGIELNYNNLEAMIANRRDRRGGNIWEKVDEPLKSFVEKLGEDEDYESTYKQELTKLSDKLADELLNPEDTYIDIKAITLMQKQISVMTKASDKGSFEIPVEIDGSKVSMHVTLKNDDSGLTRMEASIQTYEFGLLTATLYEKDGIINGMLTTSSNQGPEEAEYLEGVKEKLCERLADRIKDLGVDRERINILYHVVKQPAKVSTAFANAMEGNEKSTDTSTLLKMARAFIEAVS